jgi:hypothetical protein
MPAIGEFSSIFDRLYARLVVDRCLSFDPENGGVKSVRVTAQKELDIETKKAKQKAEVEEKEKAKKAALSLALKVRHMRLP